MIDNLPWSIQRNILDFGPKNSLHKQLKKQNIFFRKLCSVNNKNYRKYLKDCLEFTPLLDHPVYDLDWHVWILKKVYIGECPWLFIEVNNETEQMVIYLLKCANLRRKNIYKYGGCLFYGIMRLLLFMEWHTSDIEYF